MRIKIKDFRDLEVWQKGMEIVGDIYKIGKKYPKEEIYNLKTHSCKTAISIPSNIAEGFNRHKNREYARFLYISLGSCAELETQVEIAFRQEYITESDKTEILDKINHESRMLSKLIERLRADI